MHTYRLKMAFKPVLCQQCSKKSNPWPKKVPDLQLCLKIAFQFVYLCLEDILVQKNNLFQMERFKLVHIGVFLMLLARHRNRNCK